VHGISRVLFDYIDKSRQCNAKVDHSDHGVCDLKIKPSIRKRFDRDKIKRSVPSGTKPHREIRSNEERR